MNVWASHDFPGLIRPHVMSDPKRVLNPEVDELISPILCLFPEKHDG